MTITDKVSFQGQIFRLNSCRIWYNRGGSLQHVAVESIEVRLTLTSDGTERATIVAKTTSNQEIFDNLWTSCLGANASPFLESCEAVEAFKNNDPGISSIIKFAPDPGRHPRYSFSTEADARIIMSAIVGRTLLQSMDIHSIKSEMTHGNAFESKCETLQVWEEPSPSGSETRVRFFRNTNTTTDVPVIDFNITCLQESVCAPRGNEQVFMFNCAHDLATWPMKYLKIAFATNDGQRTFLAVLQSGRRTQK